MARRQPLPADKWLSIDDLRCRIVQTQLRIGELEQALKSTPTAIAPKAIDKLQQTLAMEIAQLRQNHSHLTQALQQLAA